MAPPTHVPSLICMGVCGYVAPPLAPAYVSVRTVVPSMIQLTASLVQSMVYVWNVVCGLPTGEKPPRSYVDVSPLLK